MPIRATRRVESLPARPAPACAARPDWSPRHRTGASIALPWSPISRRGGTILRPTSRAFRGCVSSRRRPPLVQASSVPLHFLLRHCKFAVIPYRHEGITYLRFVAIAQSQTCRRSRYRHARPPFGGRRYHHIAHRTGSGPAPVHLEQNQHGIATGLEGSNTTQLQEGGAPSLERRRPGCETIVKQGEY